MKGHAGVIMTVLAIAGAATAADKKVQMKDPPAAVQKTVQAEGATGAKIVGLDSERVTYEAVVEKNGKKSEVADAAGKAIKP